MCCRFTNTFEFDDFIYSAKFFLENFDRSDVCINPPESALKEGVRIGKSICQASKAFGESPLTKWMVNDKNAEEYDAYCTKTLSGTFPEPHGKVEFPFLLYQMGSGFVILKVCLR